MSGRCGVAACRYPIPVGCCLASVPVLADYAVNLTPGVTGISQQVYGLHMVILQICAAIGLVVFGAMGYAIVRHRKSAGAIPARFHGHRALEVLWTLVPFLILVGMAIPATRVLRAMSDTSNADLTIKVTGYQWRWRYDYLDQGIGFFSTLATSQDAIHGRAPKDEHYLREVDRPLVVPTNKKIRFLTTANDVIHSWWVPDLGWKKDAIPGFINESWARIDRPGTYRGQCTELCGVGHGFMPIVLQALPEADYRHWLDQQQAEQTASAQAGARPWGRDELMGRGQEIFSAICAACHQATGLGIPGVFPALKGSRIATGPLPAHLDIVLNGKPGTAMQAFGQQFSDSDLAAVITYERNAFGNTTGDLVQPAEVRMARAVSERPPAAAQPSTAEARP
jgi:cytochrome c oxidase subunit II